MVHPSLVMKIKSLDKRFTGGYQFKYCVDFNFRDAPFFIERRNWCWETWGPSCEYKFINNEDDYAWCWIVDSYKIRLYFKDDEQMNWFKLRWE